MQSTKRQAPVGHLSLEARCGVWRFWWCGAVAALLNMDVQVASTVVLGSFQASSPQYDPPWDLGDPLRWAVSFNSSVCVLICLALCEHMLQRKPCYIVTSSTEAILDTVSSLSCWQVPLLGLYDSKDSLYGDMSTYTMTVCSSCGRHLSKCHSGGQCSLADRCVISQSLWQNLLFW